jgi:hypothetical protein
MNCGALTFVAGRTKNFPKISQNFGKTFYLIGNIKVTTVKNGGCEYQETSQRDPIRVGTAVARDSTLLRTARSCIHILLLPRKKTVEVGIILAQKLFLHQHFNKELDVGSAGLG